MEYNKLLQRQLSRISINSVEDLPNPDTWKQFLEVVNKTYLEAEEERYLRERSMEISSREMLELTKNLEIAQHLGHIGYWEINLSNSKVHWSKELYSLFGLNPGDALPNYKEFINLIYEEDRPLMQTYLEQATTDTRLFDIELRVKVMDGEYRWFYVRFQNDLKDNVPYLRGVAIDITNRKQNEEEITKLNNQLILSSRLAGMADVASSTLHNVGNVLNSANVSATYLKEHLTQFNMDEIDKVKSLLQENMTNLAEFLTKDPQGKFVPEYLLALIQNLNEEYERIDKELDNLSNHLTHVNDIIVTQNDISRTSGMSEKVFLPQILDTALEMTDFAFAQHNIDIVKDYDINPFVVTDKVKLLQIIINLIRNAKDSILDNNLEKKKIITFSIKKGTVDNSILLQIKDNGGGVLPENLTKIFSLGFTTKKQGHGFGLHMSAIHAKELGGSLTVESGGFEEGASFNLILPNVESI